MRDMLWRSLLLVSTVGLVAGLGACGDSDPTPDKPVKQTAAAARPGGGAGGGGASTIDVGAGGVSSVSAGGGGGNPFRGGRDADGPDFDEERRVRLKFSGSTSARAETGRSSGSARPSPGPARPRS